MAKKKYLFLLKQDVNDDYDTFDSIIVCAMNEDDARKIHPHQDQYVWNEKVEKFLDSYDYEDDNWAPHINDIQVTKIGIADDAVPLGVVLGSFNAG